MLVELEGVALNTDSKHESFIRVKVEHHNNNVAQIFTQ